MPTVVYGDFEWDEAKAEANEVKHGVRFEEAAQAFTDPYSVDFADAVHPDRLVTVAMSPQERILYVVTAERAARVRIISARRASPHEQRIYEADP
ncbi:MAG: BrnT family toxin [Polyangiaceae bacterium]